MFLLYRAIENPGPVDLLQLDKICREKSFTTSCGEYFDLTELNGPLPVRAQETYLFFNGITCIFSMIAIACRAIFKNLYGKYGHKQLENKGEFSFK